MKTEKEIRDILGKRFNIDSAVQVLPKDKDEVLYLIEAIPISCDSPVGGLLGLCEDIAEALGGSLYGTVNLDFTVPEKTSFEMMVVGRPQN